MDSSAARAQWQATRESNTPHVVSLFYEQLTQKLTGAEHAPSYDEGDLILWLPKGATFGLEVKGGSSNHAFRIEDEQLARHHVLADRYPYDGFLYFLFGYTSYEPRKVENGDRRRCMVRNAILRGFGRRFLIERTRHLWIVPVQLIETLHQMVGIGASAFPTGSGVRIQRRMLQTFAHETQEAQNSWSVRNGTVDILPPRGRTRRISFGVTMFCYNGMPDIPVRGAVWK
ncbi:MAG: hypothetical protein NUW02_01935 [Candidatus Campbellbacteria bacterium]|nr:hypothetical protein [Candidatus Campbellbacteria bacterium]